MAASLSGPTSGTRSPAWRYWARRLLPDVELTPLRIAMGYVVFGVAALFLSDVLFVLYLREPLLSQVQALKGGVEVIVTAWLIYVLTSRRESQLQRTNARLERNREELQVLHRVLRHNLRNDVNVLRGYSKRIFEQLPPDQLAVERRAVLETIGNVTRYVEQASRIKRVAASDGTVRTYDLTATIPRILADNRQRFDDAEVSTTLPESATVEANHMFDDALLELLVNAVEHNDADTPRVSCTVDPGIEPAHMVEIRIADDGPGIPPNELDPLRGGSEDQLLHPSGLGLWFVKWTIRHSGGELDFEGNARGGTTVVVRVPKAPGMLRFPLSSLLDT